MDSDDGATGRAAERSNSVDFVKLGMGEEWDNENADSSSSEDGHDEPTTFQPTMFSHRMISYGSDNSPADESVARASFALHDYVADGNIEAVRSVIEAWMELPAHVETRTALGLNESLSEEDRESKLRTLKHNHLDRLFERRDGDSCTPLHVAISCRRLECMKVLIEAGSKLNSTCNGTPVLHFILSVGSIRSNQTFSLEALNCILSSDSIDSSRNVEIDSRDDLFRTCIHLIAECNFAPALDIVRNYSPHELEKLWCAKDIEGNTAAHVACRVGAVEVLRNICKDANGTASATQRNFQGMTALHIAAENNFADGCKMLLHLKEERDDRGLTSLQIAQQNSCSAAISVLSDNNQITNQLVSSSGKKTALFYHDVCSKHYTCPPKFTSSRGLFDIPPENVNRLRVLLDENTGILRCTRLESFLDWQESTKCDIIDVLRVHDWKYISSLQMYCSQLDEKAIGELDPDTSISGSTYDAALHAAGAVCNAIDQVCDGTHRNAFCAVRPPGHHAGPRGIVQSKYDGSGSHGFCLLNNAAIGAAYARCVYRRKGIKRVAIVDFDVHHGNGTEACIKNLAPNSIKSTFETSFGELKVESSSYKPWLNEDDGNNVFFASIHGFGKHVPGQDLSNVSSGRPMGMFYPADGESFGYGDYDISPEGEARIIDVGQNSKSRLEWRRSWREHVLPQLYEFEPDIVIISAGFDAHKKDSLNHGYISALEQDYYWLTRHLVRLANVHASGRVVSVLEGGYAIEGGIVSSFARSVCAHVAALIETTESEKLFLDDLKWEQEHEDQLVEAIKQRRIQKEESGKVNGFDQADKSDCEMTLDTEEPVPKRTKRMTKPVDYKAANDELNAELEKLRRQDASSVGNQV